eukprot:gene20430-14966_t
MSRKPPDTRSAKSSQSLYRSFYEIRKSTYQKPPIRRTHSADNSPDEGDDNDEDEDDDEE